MKQVIPCSKSFQFHICRPDKQMERYHLTEDQISLKPDQVDKEDIIFTNIKVFGIGGPRLYGNDFL